MAELLIAKIDTFTKAGRFVAAGSPVNSDEVDYDADTSTNLVPAPEGVDFGAAVQAAPIAPTGPNPTAPQQLAPGTVQTADGYYDRGVKVVGEVTKPAEQRFVQIVDAEDNTQGKVQEALDNAGGQNNDDDLVAGTVTDVSARIAEADAAQLDALEAAEKDREVPRKGVLAAIDARRAAL